MPATDRHASPRRVVMVVANDVTNDTRVKKSAISVARMGFEVIVLAVAPTGPRRETTMGPVRIIRTPVDLSVRRVSRRAKAQEDNQEGRRTRRGSDGGRSSLGERLDRLRQSLGGSSDTPQLTRLEALATYRAGKRDVEVTIALLKERIGGLPAKASGLARVRAGIERRLLWRRIHRLRDRARSLRDEYMASLESPPPSPHEPRVSRRDRRAGWRQLVPELHDFERAFAPVLEELAPDIIHAHDFPMIGIAARHAVLASARDESVRVVYDAHEFTPGVALPDPRRSIGYLDLEAEYIGRVDAVTTVSPQIAERLASHHGLEQVPDVVLNVPLAGATRRASLRTVRDVIGLAAGVPLVVYSGNTSANRRVELLVEAMAWVPDAHLVVVCGDSSQRLERLRGIARRGGYADRFHVAPYAPPDQVAQYLSNATVGVHPLSTDHLNHHLALPNKLFEYMHAGIPVVVSDNPAMAAFVREHSLGAVFHGDDAAALAEGINDVLADPSRFDGHRDHRLLDRYTWEAQEPILRDVYARVTGADVEIDVGIPFRLDEQHDVGDSRVGRAAMRDASLRLLIGPSNMAGQGWEWARALETVTDAAVEVLALERGFNFPADERITSAEWNDIDWQLRTLRRVLRTHTHVLFEAGNPIFGRLNGNVFSHDVPALRAHDIATGVVLHGSEVRDPRLHRDLEPYSPFSRGGGDWLEALQDRVDHLRPLLEEFDGPLFVSTAGLLDYLPEARWLPVVVDPAVWHPRRDVLDHPGLPIVAHAPTSGRLKGTGDVIPVCEDLAERGVIEFRRFEGIPYKHMPEVIQDADVVVDGLLLGDYGVTACQSLASGRVVVGNVAERVRRRIAGTVPIVQATPSTLREVIVDLVEDPAALRRRAVQGPEFVQRFHDGSYSGKTLAEWLENSR